MSGENLNNKEARDDDGDPFGFNQALGNGAEGNISILKKNEAGDWVKEEGDSNVVDDSEMIFPGNKDGEPENPSDGDGIEKGKEKEQE